MRHTGHPSSPPGRRDHYPLFEGVVSSLVTSLLVIALYALCQGPVETRRGADPCAAGGGRACITGLRWQHHPEFE